MRPQRSAQLTGAWGLAPPQSFGSVAPPGWLWSQQRRLQCLAASRCWVSALLSWETMRFTCRSVEGTTLQAAGLQCFGEWSMILGLGGEGAEDLRALQPSDKHCVQPHWAAEPAPSCYMCCYYRAKHLRSSGFKFLPCHCLVCYLRLLPGL